MDRAPPGIGMRGSSLVDRSFQRSYESLNGFRVRPFGAGRWHHAGSQLVYYLFSQFGILSTCTKSRTANVMPPDFSLSLWQPIQNSLISAFWDSIGRFVAVAAVRDGCPPWATLRSLVIKTHRTVLIRTAAMRCVMECKSLILKVQAQEQNG